MSTTEDYSALEHRVLEEIAAQFKSGRLDNRIKVPLADGKWAFQAFSDPKIYLENRLKIERIMTPGMVDAGLLDLIAKGLGLKVGRSSSPTSDMVVAKLRDIKRGDDNLLITAKVVASKTYSGIAKGGKNPGKPYSRATLTLDDGTARRDLTFYQNDGNADIFKMISDKTIDTKNVTASKVVAKEAKTAEGYNLEIGWGGGIVIDEIATISVKNELTPIGAIKEGYGVISVMGRVVDAKEVRKFSSGKQNRDFFLVDKDGASIRVVAWNDAVAKVPDDGVIQLNYVNLSIDKWRKERDFPDVVCITVDNPSQIVPQKVKLDDYPTKRAPKTAKPTVLMDAKGSGELVEFVGTVLDLSSRRWDKDVRKFHDKAPYYFACQTETDGKVCNKGCLKNDDGTFTCKDPAHGKIPAEIVKKKLMITASVSDGSLTLETTLYANLLEAIYGKSNDELVAEYDELVDRDPDHGHERWFVSLNAALEGKVFKVSGSVVEGTFGLSMKIGNITPIPLAEAVAYEKKLLLP